MFTSGTIHLTRFPSQEMAWEADLQNYREKATGKGEKVWKHMCHCNNATTILNGCKMPGYHIFLYTLRVKSMGLETLLAGTFRKSLPEEMLKLLIPTSPSTGLLKIYKKRKLKLEILVSWILYRKDLFLLSFQNHGQWNVFFRKRPEF